MAPFTIGRGRFLGYGFAEARPDFGQPDHGRQLLAPMEQHRNDEPPIRRVSATHRFHRPYGHHPMSSQLKPWLLLAVIFVVGVVTGSALTMGLGSYFKH